METTTTARLKKALEEGSKGGEISVPGEIKAKKKKFKVLRPSQIIKKERNILEFTGRFLESFGKPESHAKWFFTGPSYSGKSSLLFEVVNYLTQFGNVDYNNHEEAGGDSDTVARKLIQSGITKDKDSAIKLYKAHIIDPVYETWEEYLSKKRSAPFGVLDSFQHAMLTKQGYIHLTNKFCNARKQKSLLFVSHWVKDPLTKFIKHDCDIKVEVIGFVARVESRYGGNKPFVIWEDGAKSYWGKNYTKVIAGKYWPGIKK